MIAELLLLIALSSGNENDDRLISAQIKAGDKKAFHKFYNKHQSHLFSFLISKGLSDQEAEDLIQQAFLIIWEKRTDIDPGRSLRSYLFTTAYNRMLNYFRDQS
jgi:RNA polymerase sigma-70 factor, ECF subfamily